MICENCNAPVILLFTSYTCSAECDLVNASPKAIANNDGKFRHLDMHKNRKVFYETTSLYEMVVREEGLYDKLMAVVDDAIRRGGGIWSKDDFYIFRGPHNNIAADEIAVTCKSRLKRLDLMGLIDLWHIVKC